ncbi:hypothetical protein D3C81_1759230 [compost metagenome]
MQVVATPISTIVTSSIFLRPRRSPRWPNTMPANGRAIKPTAKLPNAAMVLSIGFSLGKNNWPRTSAAAKA